MTEETVEEVEIAKKENNPEEDAKANPDEEYVMEEPWEEKSWCES